MQAGKEEPYLTKHNPPDGILSVDGSKDSIILVSELLQKKLKDDISLSSSSFVERSYSMHSFSVSNEIQLYGYDEETGGVLKYLSCLRPLIAFFCGSFGYSQRNRRGSWEIPSDCVYDLTPIGSGAHGKVYRGYLYNEVVAVKEITGELNNDIKLLKKLKHPNVIKVIGICSDCTNIRIVMEYCPFGNLYDELHSGVVISPDKVLNWAVQIAEGMNYLHKHKVIHRDLKSANILVSYNDVLKISDFGTSCRWDGYRTVMSCTGTYRWMAPEAIRSERCSEKVDIWSYGVVLWELLISEVPYKKFEALQVMYGVGNNSLHLHVPQTFPWCFKYLLKRCWNRKPSARPSFQSILKHLRLKTTEKEICNFHSSDYPFLQTEWKSEVNSRLGKYKNVNSSSSSESDDQEDKHAAVLQMYKRMQNMYNALYHREQQISKREHDLVKKIDSLSLLYLEQAHGCLNYTNQNWRGCCSEVTKDSVSRPENLSFYPSRTACRAAVQRQQIRVRNNLYRNSFGGSLSCNSCPPCRGSLNNLHRSVRSHSTPELNILARIPETSEMTNTCKCQQCPASNCCVQNLKKCNQTRVKFQGSSSSSSVCNHCEDKIPRPRHSRLLCPKSSSNQSSLSEFSSIEGNTSEHTCTQNCHESLSNISNEDILKSMELSYRHKNRIRKAGHVSFNLSTSTIDNKQ